MQYKTVWYGSPANDTWCSSEWSSKGREMTAISTVYTGREFVVAADGRCKADGESGPGKHDTERAQKIFPIETENIKLAYYLAGFSFTDTDHGEFDMLVECEKQVCALRISRFANGREYISRFCRGMKKAMTTAKREGRIQEFPLREELLAGTLNPISRLAFVGYYRGSPLWIEARFYHDEQNNKIDVSINEFEFVPMQTRVVGPRDIASMLYDPSTQVDIRLSRYKKDPCDGALTWVVSYIEACSDPAALEINPACKYIGGHIHAAEITNSSFKWLVAPKVG